MRSDLDFYGIDDLLGAEERLVRDSVRTFVARRLMPVIQQHYREGSFPRQLIAELAELGLLGATVEGYGGAGVSQLAYGVMTQELERGDSGLRSFVSVQNGLVIYPILTFGDDDQRQRWLPRLIKGELVGCYGLTEPDHGSDPGAMSTRARRDGESYVLDGTKRWITNATLADLAVVFARCEDTIAGFVVERGTPGFAARSISGKLSMRASDTGELVFEECRVPAANRLPDARGLRSPLSCLNQARYGIAWGAIGAAKACFEEALAYAGDRVQFDEPIAARQLVQRKLVRIYSEITQAELLCLRLAQLKQQGRASHVAVSLAKRNNVAMALRAARACRDILGANGIVDDYCAMRHMCNLESVYTYEGAHDIHTLVVGQALTGFPAFR